MGKWWQELWQAYRGRLIGTTMGLICGFIYLAVGIWKTLLFLLFVGIGYSLGRRKDRHEELSDVIHRIMPTKWVRK
ncbi:DUF2273 domain-containing protein [Mechercharimyces sp. CAU 1602]|uniref:DUF2273 domain-containing protein n=1 Tax=Mechercharimyces sp. CAU 1602 TaxID=2973933 RepID=UPI0021626B9C|nr:DUF2273 domain-containing protein [Mechercharimyces sp. CAU 1602]MCS1350783.1 DUF2273 domain-containing protein [Mechercharimyces sp. CAU 1602]